MIVISGAAGMGKTALLAEAGRIAEGCGWRVLRARGAEAERSFAFGIVRQLFEPALAEESSAARRELLSDAAELARPALGLSAELPTDDPARSFAVIHGLYWLWANLAAQAPLVALIDDVRLSDAPSLRWLGYCARRAADLDAVMMLTARDGVTGATAELAEVLEDPAVEHIIPEALSEAGTQALLRAAFGMPPSDAFTARCRAVTGGNPYLLGELARDLARREVVPDDESVVHVEEATPDTVRAWVRGRVAGLGVDATPLAEAAAVIGAQAPLRMVASMAGQGIEHAAAAADALAAAGILAPGLPLSFAHPLTEHAVLDGIPAGRQSLMRVAAARVLADAGAPPGQVASHLLAGEAQGAEWVVEALALAAREAMASGAPDLAASYLKRALDEPPLPASRPEILAALGVAFLLAGDHQAAATLTQARDVATSPSRRAELAIHGGRALFIEMRVTEARALLSESIDELGADDTELALRLEAELAMAAQLDTSRPLAPERLERYAGLEGVTDGERHVLMALAWSRTLTLSTPAADVVALMERASADAALFASGGGDSPTVAFGIGALTSADSIHLADRLHELRMADVRRRGSYNGFILASSQTIFGLLRSGRVRETEVEGRSLMQLAQMSGFSPWHLGCLLQALVEQGRCEEGFDMLAASGWSDELPEFFPFSMLLYGRSRLHLAAGAPDRALADARELERRLKCWGVPGNPRGTPWRLVATRALLQLGERDEARAVARAHLGFARAWGTPEAVGIALWNNAITAANGPELDRLIEAAQILEGSTAVLEYGGVLADIGAALRRANRREDAREPLRQALDIAHRCGADALELRVREELLATGARPRKAVLRGADSLTASERRVSEMAATGMSNKQIAQSLFVTAKTIETHLGHAYLKLDISSRRELGAALQAPV